MAALSSALLAVPLLSAPAPRPHRAAEPLRVLLIFSEGKDLPGNILLEQGVRAAFDQGSSKRVEFYTEHLDASRFADEGHYRIFRDYLGAKYAGQEPDLLLIIMARDFSLAERLPVELFPKVPAVFVTTSELPMPESLKRPGLRGVILQLDVQGTLMLAKRLQPDLRKVVVIGGKSESDQRTLARIQKATAESPGRLSFEFWTNQPFSEIQTNAKAIPSNSAILLSTIFEDGAGQTVYMTHAARMLSPPASAPVYSVSQGAIGSGALGGAVVDPRGLGTQAARLGLEMLKGEATDRPAVVQSTDSILTVDWAVLERWHIDPDLLPKECAIANREPSIWEEHKVLIGAGLAVILAQALTIAALVAQHLRRRRAEAEILRQRDELAHVTRVSTMGQLASSLAHEINQPLGAILRNAEAAELFLQREKPDLVELKAILADIRKDDQRAGGVIEKMRSLLKRQGLQSEQVDVRELLDDTVALALPDARARQVRLILETPPKLPQIRGDRVHLQQVLLNLIINAMDALNNKANGGRTVSLRATQTGDELIQISVSDCGSGIPPDKIGRVFDPFFTTKSEGLGMGLAISRTIVEAHGGKIRAENNSSSGATFHITLPVHSS